MNTKTQLDDQELQSADTQIARVYRALRGGEWATLPELHDRTGDPVASISAQLRHLRRGGFTINRRARKRGLFEYSLGQKRGGQYASGDA
jgi:hypothetical protein